MVRIGVIGVGFGARVQIPGFRSEGFEVTAVCSRRRERAERAARDLGIPAAFTDYREMLDRASLDAVSIVTPPSLHYEMTMAALDAGKHVLCEKPFAMDERQAGGMWERVQETGLTGMVTHEFRFEPDRAYIEELVSQGYLGKPRSVSITLFGSSRRRAAGPVEWRQQASQGGGQLRGQGSHYIDCLRDWFGEITGVCGRVFTGDLAGAAEAGRKEVDDAFSFLVTFAGGGWGSMSASFVAPFGSGARFELNGSEGALIIPPPGGTVLGARSGEASQPRELPIPERFRPVTDDRDARLPAFRLLARRFREGISEGTSPAPNFYDGYRCQQVIDAVKESPLKSL